MEFAIVASLLFLVLFGTIQFGIAFNRYQGIHAAAREGARLGSLPTSSVEEIVDRVKDSISIVAESNVATGCSGSLATDTACVAITPSGSNSFQPCDLRSGDPVKVEVRLRTAITIPLWGNRDITMTGRGEFMCE